MVRIIFSLLSYHTKRSLKTFRKTWYVSSFSRHSYNLYISSTLYMYIFSDRCGKTLRSPWAGAQPPKKIAVFYGGFPLRFPTGQGKLRK